MQHIQHIYIVCHFLEKSLLLRFCAMDRPFRFHLLQYPSPSHILPTDPSFSVAEICISVHGGLEWWCYISVLIYIHISHASGYHSNLLVGIIEHLLVIGYLKKTILVTKLDPASLNI